MVIIFEHKTLQKLNISLIPYYCQTCKLLRIQTLHYSKPIFCDRFTYLHTYNIYIYISTNLYRNILVVTYLLDMIRGYGNGYKFNFVKTMMMLQGILTFSKFIT